MSKEPMTLEEANDNVDRFKKNCSLTLFGIPTAIENTALAAFTRVTYTREYLDDNGEKISYKYKDDAPAPVILMAEPGVGKTDLAGNAAQSIGGKFTFIAGQPDLSVSKIMGRDIYVGGSFSFAEGDILANVVLCDEFTRNPPKLLAAFFQAFEERLAIADTFDHALKRVVNKRMPLTPINPEDPTDKRLYFFPIATGNPFEQEGTYDLPEAMWDRFAIHFGIDYPDRENEKLIDSSTVNSSKNRPVIRPVMTLEKAWEIGKFYQTIEIKQEAMEYIERLMENSRQRKAGKPERRISAPTSLRKFIDEYVTAGLSPRSNYHLKAIVRTFAGFRGRMYVTVDDVKDVFHMVADHRMILNIKAQGRNIKKTEVISRVLGETPIPSVGSKSTVIIDGSKTRFWNRFLRKAS